MTPSPTASTTPATSWPGARGKELPNAPATVSGVGVADAAGVHLHADMSSARFGDFDVGEFEFLIRRGDARDLHRCHVGEITPERSGAPRREAVHHLSGSRYLMGSAHYGAGRRSHPPTIRPANAVPADRGVIETCVTHEAPGTMNIASGSFLQVGLGVLCFVGRVRWLVPSLWLRPHWSV